ncbi:MAG: hypothetical protein QXX19_08910 [Candidatus Caldarchaeum sp.]
MSLLFEAGFSALLRWLEFAEGWLSAGCLDGVAWDGFELPDHLAS